MHKLSHRYRVLRPLGGSGVARVELAQDRLLGAPVVLKTLPVSHQAAEELNREGARLERLRHPGLVEFVERFEGRIDDRDTTVVGHATRWIDGEPLDRWAAGTSTEDRLAVFERIVETVDYLHRSAWLHLDIKPDNVLWTPSGPVLLDLGSAQPADAQRGTAGGTLGFAAPEILLGEAPSFGSDLYSLGVLLYGLLSGVSPFAETDGSALRTAVLRGGVVPLRARVPTIDPVLGRLTDELLARRPGDRLGSCEELLERLRLLGVQGPRRLGLPSIIGRSDAIAELREQFEDPERPPVPLALIGPLGSGRTRLAQELLAILPRDEGAVVLDVASLGPVERSLPAVLDLLGAPGAGALDDPRLPTWLDGATLRGALYLGRLEDAPGLADRSDLLVGLSRAGLQVVLGAEHLPPWAEPYAVSPLPAEALDELTAAVGAPAGVTRTSLVAAADGLPGGLLHLLVGGVEVASHALAALGRDADLVRLLPQGTPVRLIDAGPARLRQAVARAIDVGAIRRIGQRLFGADPAPPSGPIDATDAAVVRGAVAANGGRDPWVEGLLLARIGDCKAARARLPTLYGGPSRPEALEIARRLVDAGIDDVRKDLVQLLINAGRIQEAKAELELLDVDDPRVAELWAVWARTGEPDAPWARPLAWIERRGWHPVVAGCVAWSMWYANDLGKLTAFFDRMDAEVPSGFDDEPYLAACRLGLAVRRAEAGESQAELRALLEGIDARFDQGRALPRIVLMVYANGWAALDEKERALAAWRRAVALSDEAGLLGSAAAALQMIGNTSTRLGRAADARRAYLQALSIYAAIGAESPILITLNNLADLETRSGRLPAAERYLRRFDKVRERLGWGGQAEERGRLLWAGYHLAAGEPRRVLERLASPPLEPAVPQLLRARNLLLAEASIELGSTEDARNFLDQISEEGFADPSWRRRYQIARGRVHLAIARFHLARASAGGSKAVGPLERGVMGRALLAAAGEDLHPDSFAHRREQLRLAGSLLQGPAQQQALALRDRMLDRPGADLDQVVDLIESIGDAKRFVQGLAQVVARALGAHRVLVMLRIPGLGRQVSAQELSGQEVAGLAPEVWRRIRRADDVWRADDAFADPLLRRLSSTVRTFQVKSVVAVAIPRGDDAIGALYVDDLQQPGRFTDNDVVILQRLARAIGTVAEQLPTLGPVDGLAVHDVYGVYLSDPEVAARMKTTLERLRAQEQGNLLVSGPTGAGKTWMAKRVATEVLGLRGMIEVVLRPSDPDKLISQLWGTKPGDFTGAVRQIGAIQRAWQSRSALFLDEVQNLDEAGQRVLLPLLELPHRRFGSMTGEVQQLDRPLHIILGTNARLENREWAQHFREDLWFRMSQIRVDLPALSERGREAIYRHLGDLLRNKGQPAPERVFDASALARIAAHAWPGNLRGLSGFVDQVAFGRSDDDPPLTAARLSDFGLVPQEQAAPVGPRRSPLRDAEARVVLEALEECGWVQTEAADKLGISKYALHRMLRRHDLIDEVRRRRFGLDAAS